MLPDREMMVKATVDAGGLGLSTLLDWTASGDLERMTDPRGHVWSAGYDAARRRRDLTQPDGGRVEWVRNGNGWVTGIRRAVDNPAQSWAQTGFAYDENGRLHSVTDPLGRVTETLYDAAGQVEAEKAAVETALQQESARYTYYADGQMATIADPRGHVLRHEYDGYGRLSRLVHRMARRRAMPMTPTTTGRVSRSATGRLAGRCMTG
jgi:YD repeat-containing protein